MEKISYTTAVEKNNRRDVFVFHGCNAFPFQILSERFDDRPRSRKKEKEKKKKEEKRMLNVGAIAASIVTTLDRYPIG